MGSTTNLLQTTVCKQHNALILKAFKLCGLDGTRTRDPMRDRHVF